MAPDASWPRTIGHVDMDSFYVSVEVRDDPQLAGKPVVVGGDAQRRGVVSAASYEARRYGVHSALPMATAIKRCPQLIVLSGNMRKYRTVSRELRRILATYSPCIEPLSLDEAFLELSGTSRLFGTARELGESIRRKIRDELALTASVGIAPSKFVAKLASEYRKPDGLTVVAPADTATFVQSLPLERLWGVGPATHAALTREGIRTIAALAAADAEQLAKKLGSSAKRWVALAQGIDDRPVVPHAPAKSISHETTFDVDLHDEETLLAVLSHLAELVARRARKASAHGRVVTLKLRLPDFTTFTRSRTLEIATDDATEIGRVAHELLQALKRRRAGVRLLGVGLSGFEAPVQLALDFSEGEEGGTEAERRRRLHTVEDQLVSRFGGTALSRARGLLARTRGPGGADQSPK